MEVNSIVSFARGFTVNAPYISTCIYWMSLKILLLAILITNCVTRVLPQHYFCVQKLFLVVRLVISDWWAEPARGRAVWRSVLKESGAQSVMTHGVLMNECVGEWVGGVSE